MPEINHPTVPIEYAGKMDRLGPRHDAHCRQRRKANGSLGSGKKNGRIKPDIG